MSELSLSRFNRFEETDRIIHPSVSRRSFLKLCGVFGGAAALYGLSPLLGRGPEATPLYEAEIVPVRFNLDLGKLDSDPEVSSIYRSNILRAIDHMSPNQGKSKLEELDQDNGEPWIIYLNVPAGLLVDFNQVVGPVDKQGAYVANSNGLYGVGIGFLASALYAMSRSEQGQDMGIEVMQKVLRQTPLPGFNVETSISIDTDTEDKNLILQFPKARDLQLAFTYEPKTKKLIMDMGELGDWENYDPAITQSIVINEINTESVEMPNRNRLPDYKIEKIEDIFKEPEVLEWANYTCVNILGNIIGVDQLLGIASHNTDIRNIKTIKDVISSLKTVIINQEMLLDRLPLLLRIKYRNPLGPIIKDRNGNVVPFLVRLTTKDRYGGNIGPFNLHGNVPYFYRARINPWDEWYGIDTIPAKGSTNNKFVSSPIDGKVIVVSKGTKSDGPGNSIWIEGTDKYSGLYVRILHMLNINVTRGKMIDRGQILGPMGNHEHFELKSKGVDGRFLPLPSELAFGNESGLSGIYSGGNYRDGDVVGANNFNWLKLHTYLAFIDPQEIPEGIRPDIIRDFTQRYYKELISHLPSYSRNLWYG